MICQVCLACLASIDPLGIQVCVVLEAHLVKRRAYSKLDQVVDLTPSLGRE